MATYWWRMTTSGLAVIGVESSELPEDYQQLIAVTGDGPLASPLQLRDARSRGDRRAKAKRPPGAKSHTRASNNIGRKHVAPARPSTRNPDATTRTKTRRAVEPGKATNKETNGTRLLGLLSRRKGATIAEIIEATGWLAHSSRAALTGLRRKWHITLREQHVGDRVRFTGSSQRPGPRWDRRPVHGRDFRSK